MATTGTVLAKNMALYTGSGSGTKITCQVDASLELSSETFDTTCKDSGAWATPVPGTKSWSMSGSANLAFDATNGWNELYDAWTDQTAITVLITTAVVGDKKYSGSAYVTSLSLTSSGNDGPVTFDFEFTGTGALTEATVS